MEIQFKEIGENEYAGLAGNAKAPLTQNWFFGEWQAAAGRKVIRYGVLSGGETIGFFQAVKFSLPFSQNFLYIPHGPVLLGESGSHFFNAFKNGLREMAKKENTTFIRFDFFNPSGETAPEVAAYFKKVPAHTYKASYFQPKNEWLLNIGKSEGELLAEMHPKTRYNIHLAENKGANAEINVSLGGYFEDFYKLLEETAIRNKFGLHSKEYYCGVFKNCGKNGNAFLSIVRYNGKILAANLIVIFGETAFFLYGGSSDEHKNLMAPYLAHWEAIKEAKNRGCKVYNFGAISADDDGFEGISRFKKGFGGRPFQYSDSYDLVAKPLWYRLYNLRRWFLSHK